jgi:hypothetical protein
VSGQAAPGTRAAAAKRRQSVASGRAHIFLI